MRHAVVLLLAVTVAAIVGVAKTQACPDTSWIRWRDSCYKLVREFFGRTQSQARTHCQELNDHGALLWLDSVDEKNFVKGHNWNLIDQRNDCWDCEFMLDSAWVSLFRGSTPPHDFYWRPPSGLSEKDTLLLSSDWMPGNPRPLQETMLFSSITQGNGYLYSSRFGNEKMWHICKVKDPPSTESPTTESSTTESSTTESSTTESSTTESSTTESPTTESPTTESSTTESLTTESLTTESSTTESLTTESSTTESSTTESSTTESPTTESLTTESSTTESPTTESPGTNVSTSEPSISNVPTSEPHTSNVPTSEPHTSNVPTSEPPTSIVPTSEPPTAESPTPQLSTNESPPTLSPITLETTLAQTVTEAGDNASTTADITSEPGGQTTATIGVVTSQTRTHTTAPGEAQRVTATVPDNWFLSLLSTWLLTGLVIAAVVLSATSAVALWLRMPTRRIKSIVPSNKVAPETSLIPGPQVVAILST